MSLKSTSLLPLSSFVDHCFECTEDYFDALMLGEVIGFFPLSILISREVTLWSLGRERDMEAIDVVNGVV